MAKPRRNRARPVFVAQAQRRAARPVCRVLDCGKRPVPGGEYCKRHLLMDDVITVGWLPGSQER